MGQDHGDHAHLVGEARSRLHGACMPLTPCTAGAASRQIKTTACVRSYLGGWGHETGMLVATSGAHRLVRILTHLFPRGSLIRLISSYHELDCLNSEEEEGEGEPYPVQALSTQSSLSLSPRAGDGKKGPGVPELTASRVRGGGSSRRKLTFRSGELIPGVIAGDSCAYGQLDRPADEPDASHKR